MFDGCQTIFLNLQYLKFYPQPAPNCAFKMHLRVGAIIPSKASPPNLFLDFNLQILTRHVGHVQCPTVISRLARRSFLKTISTPARPASLIPTPTTPTPSLLRAVE